MIRVWDPAVRVLHGSLAACVALAWATTAWLGGWHQRIGWAALAIVVARIVWGVVGSRRARFSDFVVGPGATWRYARLALAGRAPRHVGHNPLGAWMALAFFACVAALALTGWLYTTDRFWGDETAERVHLALAWTIVVMVVVHVVGAVLTGRHQRENLIASMVDGMKREAAPGDRD